MIRETIVEIQYILHQSFRLDVIARGSTVNGEVEEFSDEDLAYIRSVIYENVKKFYAEKGLKVQFVSCEYEQDFVEEE